MKFLIMGLFLFFAAPLFSQDTTVCIAPSTARYFLEADDERWVLREKDSLNTQLVLNQKEEILVRDSIIVTYQADLASHETRYVTLLEQNTLKDKRIKKLEGKIRLRKALEVLAIIGIVVISIL